MRIDWAALGEEAVDLLRRYLMVDTTNPPGNEAAGARFLAAVLERNGIASETVEAAPGRANLVARLAGDGSLPGIVLHHHIDVVYADRRYWTMDPFGGEVRDGYLYGRGAIDMKSTGIMHLAAVLALKRAGVPLKRDLVFLATADEEAGSVYGARFVADARRDWLAGAEYAISELGGIEVHAGYTAPLGHIVISEKTGLPLTLTARSEPGHGSMPWPDTAPHRLIRALNRLLAAERPLSVLPEVREYFSRLATVLPVHAGVGYGDLERSLTDPAFRTRFLTNRLYAAMVRTTFAVTMLKGSEKGNVIPPEASAGIDCRMLAGAEYAISELGGIEVHAGFRAPLGHIVISEKTGLPLTLTARSDPGHGSMPWPDTPPHRLIRALGRLLAAERPLRVLPEVQEYFARLASVLPGDAGVGYDDLAPSLADAAFRARFLTNRLHAAMVRTTLAVTMLHGSEKRNVIPPEASAGIDCRMLAGDDPQEIVGWIRRVIDDDRVEVTITGEAKVPNLSPADTELYKALADTLRRRAPGAVVAPEILVAFTDNWVFRRCGLHGYGWSPFIMDEGEWHRVHGNDERLSLENIRAGARAYVEMLLDVAGA